MVPSLWTLYVPLWKDQRRSKDMSKASLAIRLWRQLIRSGFDEAAVGLLCDVAGSAARDSQGIERTLEKYINEPATQQQKDRFEEAQRTSMEDAMVILEDSDGSILKDCLELYARNEELWRTQAQLWVLQCQQEWGSLSHATKEYRARRPNWKTSLLEVDDPDLFEDGHD
jgi:hypothetical protein